MIKSLKSVQTNFWCGFFALVLCLMLIDTSQAQEKCAEELAKAEQKYYEGNPDAAIVQLSACLSQSDLTPNIAQRVFKLMALVYISKNDLKLARENINRLLKLAPEYQPETDEDLPPEFVNIVNELKRERAQQLEQEKRQREEQAQQSGASAKKLDEPTKKSGKSKKWLWIGLGVAAAGGGAAVILGGGNGKKIIEEPLPVPPGKP